MRHLNRRSKLGKTTSHRRCMIANMLKSLIENERIETTLDKGKELKRCADKLITLAKKDTISAKRLAKSNLMIRFNPLTSKERKLVKNKDYSPYNADRRAIKKLFTELKDRYSGRNGGYTRLIQKGFRVGDGAKTCIVEYIR